MNKPSLMQKPISFKPKSASLAPSLPPPTMSLGLADEAVHLTNSSRDFLRLSARSSDAPSPSRNSPVPRPICTTYSR